MDLNTPIGPSECPRCPGMHHWPHQCPRAAAKNVTILPTVRIENHVKGPPCRKCNGLRRLTVRGEPASPWSYRDIIDYHHRTTECDACDGRGYTDED